MLATAKRDNAGPILDYDASRTTLRSITIPFSRRPVDYLRDSKPFIFHMSGVISILDSFGIVGIITWRCASAHDIKHEIRDELAAIDKECNHDEEWIKRVQAVLTRADEMIYWVLYTICKG